METNEKTTETNETVQHPIWRHCLAKMRAEVITYGKVYSATWLEEVLRSKRDTMSFGLAMSEIRRELEHDGFYISGRGQKGDQYVVLEPVSNQNVMAGYGRAALDALSRGVILGTNTRLDTLTTNERRKHEAILEKLATRLALIKYTRISDKTMLLKAPN